MLIISRLILRYLDLKCGKQREQCRNVSSEHEVTSIQELNINNINNNPT